MFAMLFSALLLLCGLLETKALSDLADVYPRDYNVSDVNYVPFSVYADCESQNITGSRCENWIRAGLVKYKQDAHYNMQTLPLVVNQQPIWRNDTGPDGVANYTIIGYKEVEFNVTVMVTFNSLLEVSIPKGSVAISADLTFLWVDEYLKWTPTQQNGIYNVFFDVPETWVPDFVALNSQKTFSLETSGLRSPVSITYTGAATWVHGPIALEFACAFDASDFPFDSQECTVDFTSVKYKEPNFYFHLAPAALAKTIYAPPVNGASVESGFTAFDGFVVRDAFYENSEWEIASISASQYPYYYYGQSSFVSYSIRVSRYSNYYLEIVINPMVLITFMAVLSLWMKDLQSRVLVSVTSLLTIIAVQIIVADHIPISNHNSWLGDVAQFCFSIIFTVCVETAVSSYFWNKKQGKAPIWMKYIVLISLPFRFWRFIQGKNVDEEGLELEEMITGENTLENPLIPADQLAQAQQTRPDDVKVIRPAALASVGSLTPDQIEKRRRMLYSWKRGSLSLDRIFRVTMILANFIGFFVFLSRANVNK